MIIDTSKIMYEYQLPKLTKKEYDIWYQISWVDGVRLGFHVSDTEGEIREKIDLGSWNDYLEWKQNIEKENNQ